MADQPEGGDVLDAVPVEHILDNVAQMGVVGLAHPAPRRLFGRRRGRRDHQAVLVLVVGGGEVGLLPGADRAAAVQAQKESDLLAGFEVIGVVQIEFSGGLFVEGADAAHARFSQSDFNSLCSLKRPPPARSSRLVGVQPRKTQLLLDAIRVLALERAWETGVTFAEVARL